MTIRLLILLAAMVLAVVIWHRQSVHQDNARRDFQTTERMLELTNDISFH
jgi:hypothetical protein